MFDTTAGDPLWVAGLFLGPVRPSASMSFCRFSLRTIAVVALSALALSAGPFERSVPMTEPGPFLLWDTSLTLRSGGGHADNPTYAPSFREPSGFMALGADLLVLRLPSDGNSGYLFFTGDDRRFFGAPSVRKEQTFATQGQLKHEWTDWTGTLAFHHLYADQVFDLSEQGSGTNAPVQGHVQAIGHTLGIRPALRRSLGDGWWAEGEVGFARQYFGEPLDGSGERSMKLTFGRLYAPKCSLELALAGSLRLYDDSALLAADGSYLAGTREELATRAIEGVWRHTWDAEGRWRTVLRGSATRVEDNGQGYFDHDKLSASAQVQFGSGRWTAKLTGKFVRFTYAVQQVPAPGTGARARDEVTAEAKLEYRLRPQLKCVVVLSEEHSLGNSAFDTYSARTVSAGLEWDL